MDSSVIEVQFGDPDESSHTESKYPTDLSSYGSFMDSDEDMQTEKMQYNRSYFPNDAGMDSSDAAYGSYESTSGCLSLPVSGNITSVPFNAMKLPNTIDTSNEVPVEHRLMDLSVPIETQEDQMDAGLKCPIAPEVTQEDQMDAGLKCPIAPEVTQEDQMDAGLKCPIAPEATQEDQMDAGLKCPIATEATQEDQMDAGLKCPIAPETRQDIKMGPGLLNSEDSSTNNLLQLGENSVVSEIVEELTFDETPEKNDADEQRMDFNTLSNVATHATLKKDFSKVEILSDDEDISFPKSSAESASSKGGSPSGPSCSGTSHRDLNSLSSDSDTDLPDLDMSLPLKKRKRGSTVETISSSSSCSEDESTSDIDYANLTPDQIKALIEQAKGLKHKCRCPKRKLADLPVKGPTQPSRHCNIGKGNWREQKACEACVGGFCTATHKHAKGRRRPPTRSALAKSRARQTIGQDVPIIEISDEEGSPVPNRVASEVTVTTATAGECIVLSSSDDDDDIVCERVIKPDLALQESIAIAGGSYLMDGSPEVVVLNSPSIDVLPPVPATATAPAPAAAGAPPLLTVPVAPAPAVHIPPEAPTFPTFPTFPALAPPALQPPALPLPPVLPMPPLPDDLDYWPDIDNDDLWNTIFCNHGRTYSNTGGMPANAPQENASAAVAERPSSPEGWSCPICLESKTEVAEIMSTTCGHIFCGECIRSAVKIHKKCPTCRKKLTAKQFHKIFL